MGKEVIKLEPKFPKFIEVKRIRVRYFLLRLGYFWIPEETLDLRVKRDHVTYDVWERQGYILRQHKVMLFIMVILKNLLKS